MCDYIDFEASVDKLHDLTLAVISVFHLFFSQKLKELKELSKI